MTYDEYELACQRIELLNGAVETLRDLGDELTAESVVVLARHCTGVLANDLAALVQTAGDDVRVYSAERVWVALGKFAHTHNAALLVNLHYDVRGFAEAAAKARAEADRADAADAGVIELTPAAQA